MQVEQDRLGTYYSSIQAAQLNLTKYMTDLQHHLFQLTFGGGMFTAPIDRKKVHRILDAGTGTGIWAIDMGMSFSPLSR